MDFCWFQVNRFLLKKIRLLYRKNELDKTVDASAINLQETILLFKSIFNAMTDGILVLDLENNIVDYNIKFLEFWQIPEDLVKHQKFSSVYHFIIDKFEDPEKFTKIANQVLQDENNTSYIEWNLKDRRIVGRYICPQKINDKIIGRLISIRDITEQKRSEERLSFQYEMVQLLLELNDLDTILQNVLKKICATFNFQVGIYWERNTKENVLDCRSVWHESKEKINELTQIKKTTKFKLDQGLPGKVWKTQKSEWIYDIHQTVDLEFSAAVKKTNLVSAIGVPIVFQGEAYGVIELFSSINYPIDKGLLSLFVTLSNQLVILIRKKHNEDRLRLLSRAVESNKDGMFIISVKEPDQPIIYVNPAFEKITGYSSTESIGKNSQFLQRGETDEPGLNHIRLAQQENREGTAILKSYHKNGAQFWTEIHVAPVWNDHNEADYYVAIIRNISQRKKMENQLLHHATYDGLTNLPNRILLEDRLKQAVLQSQMNKNCFAICYIDIDNFKFINDSLGHKIGDNLLVQVAARLKNIMNANDTVARLGGDEFAVIVVNLENTNTAFSKKLLKIFNESFINDKKPIKISASIGVCFYPDDGLVIDDLIKHADMAMYQAKKEGRNKICIFSNELTVHISKTHTLEYNLQFALEKNQFHLYYQPQFDLANYKIVGVEALIRWKHPELGNIPPLDFISLAEQTGLIVPIGTWALETAIKQNKRWQLMGLPPIQMAVNLSMFQFREIGLVNKIKKLLKENDLAPKYLELELTETVIMENAKQFIDQLIFLREMGVSLAIDDFGTGYSSLSYLKQLPVDKLKIDKSFIQDILKNSHDQAIVLAIIAMAKVLQLNILAEGVEDKAQALYLAEHGCDAAQGYYFSHPLDAESCTTFFNKFI